MPRQEPMPVLRRSTRKRSMPPAFTTGLSPSAKKSRTAPEAPSSAIVSPTLITLPDCAITRLLMCLDVDSLENLSTTCTYFDQLIAKKFLISVNFPFPVSFIKEVMDEDCFEKKPVLKLRCKKMREEFKTFPDSPEDYSEHKLIIHSSQDMMDYLILFQMSLLSLHKLRELDLVPDIVKQEGRLLEQSIMDSYRWFDSSLLLQLSRLGSLRCLTRLDVLVDQYMCLSRILLQLPCLLELGLRILMRPGLSKHDCLNNFIPCLEAGIVASKAPVLKVTVMGEMRRLVNKVFRNNHVEKLVVTGPCTFNLFPVMEKLKEVVVNLETDVNCSYWKSKIDDRSLHRAGICCVNIGSVYKNCPNVQRFMGVEISMVSHNQSFKEWNTKIKKRFYDDYLQQGGSKEMNAWAKTRWFERRPVLSKHIGQV